MNQAIERITADLRIIRRWNLLQRMFGRFRHIFWLGQTIVQDLSNPACLSLKHTLRAWRAGFKRLNYQIYGLQKTRDITDFLSDFKAVRTEYINGRYRELVNNKLAFGALMQLHDIPTPKVFGLIRKGIYHQFNAEAPLPAQELPELLIGTLDQLVIKPLWGYHGRGFIHLSHNSNSYRLNYSETSLAAIKSLLSRLDDYIVTEFVSQGEHGAHFFPETTNTIRIVTFWDYETGQPFIARAVQRIGTSRSHPVDNFVAGKGGLSAMIDINSGVLGPGAMLSSRRQVSWYDNHPETHVKITGSKVVGWRDICGKILEYARCFSFAPSIGWDIVITDCGFSIIEGNSTPGMAVLQVHGPLLTNQKIRRFYQHHHVIH